MRRLFAFPVGILLLLAHATPGAACSAGPFDPAEITQLLVLGQVRSLEVGRPTVGGFVEATLTLDVMRVYRGTAPSTLRFVDATSVTVETQSGRRVLDYAGGSGACGTLDDDPVGKYALIALARGDDSRWHANRVFGAIFTPQPDYDAYRWLLQRHGIAVPFLVVGPSWEPLMSAPAFAP